MRKAGFAAMHLGARTQKKGHITAFHHHIALQLCLPPRRTLLILHSFLTLRYVWPSQADKTHTHTHKTSPECECAPTKILARFVSVAEGKYWWRFQEVRFFFFPPHHTRLAYWSICHSNSGSQPSRHVTFTARVQPAPLPKQPNGSIISSERTFWTFIYLLPADNKERSRSVIHF